jgi:hypothetical protein
VVREVAGQEHCIGLRPYRANRLDRRGESGHGLVVEPLRTNVRIAQLREEKGPQHRESIIPDELSLGLAI